MASLSLAHRWMHQLREPEINENVVDSAAGGGTSNSGNSQSWSATTGVSSTDDPSNGIAGFVQSSIPCTFKLEVMRARIRARVFREGKRRASTV